MKTGSDKNLIFRRSFIRIWVLLFAFGFFGAQSVFAQLNITPLTWNVIGLDSNRVVDGPDTFPVGARVCNTGNAASNITAKFVWDSSNAYINLDASSPDTLNVSSLAAGKCNDFYFNAVVTRSTAAYNTARRYRITATNGASTVETPSPRELFVEKLVSQNRNKVLSVTGPTTVYVGQTYTYTVKGETAPGGYEQLEAFLSLSNVIFRILSVSTTYTTPVGGTNDKVYADACGWNNVTTSPSYRSCIGPTTYGGKAGDQITTVYTVFVQSTGATTASTLIYDFSGSSYHYNDDFGIKVLSITALPAPVPSINLSKSVTPSSSSVPGTDLTYSINFANSGNASAQNFQLVDPNPGSTLKINTSTDFKVGSIVNTLGTTGLSATVSYSNDNGVSYTYTPVSGGGGAPSGYDRNVTHIRWTFSGSLSSTAPNNTGSVSFVVRIR
ncbi:MAG TPA: hypothetical protein VF596_00465 [Pyrinomonadaceae bacterium]|jgi:uncharacterized repeat protein (TIGR01451 family)